MRLIFEIKTNLYGNFDFFVPFLKRSKHEIYWYHLGVIRETNDKFHIAIVDPSFRLKNAIPPDIQYQILSPLPPAIRIDAISLGPIRIPIPKTIHKSVTVMLFKPAEIEGRITVPSPVIVKMPLDKENTGGVGGDSQFTNQEK